MRKAKDVSCVCTGKLLQLHIQLPVWQPFRHLPVWLGSIWVPVWQLLKVHPAVLDTLCKSIYAWSSMFFMSSFIFGGKYSSYFLHEASSDCTYSRLKTIVPVMEIKQVCKSWFPPLRRFTTFMFCKEEGLDQTNTNVKELWIGLRHDDTGKKLPIRVSLVSGTVQ